MTAAGGKGIALFGGAFDPPHRTHVRIARAALEQLPVDELLVVDPVEPAGKKATTKGHLQPISVLG